MKLREYSDLGGKPALNADLGRRQNRVWLALILFLHIGATCTFFPPSEALSPEPLYTGDYPVHTHRVYVYRQGFLESGVPWGYDPAVSAGTVMNPHNDLGAKPQQVLGLFLPFLSPGTIVRSFLFVAVLTFPLWTLLACRVLRISSEAQVCIIVTLLAPAWLHSRLQFFSWGLAGFAAASYFSIYVLALFIVFLRRPEVRSYVKFTLVGTLLFLLHPLGPLPLIPALAFYTLTWRPLSWGWRTAAVVAPVIILILNAYWLLPYLFDWESSNPAWTWLPVLNEVDRHLTYSDWSELLKKLSQPLWFWPQVFGLSFALYGFIVMRRYVEGWVVVAFVLVSAFALYLSYFGSFVPIFAGFQPVRFILPAFVILAVPVGIAVSTLITRVGLPVGLCTASVALILVIPAIGLGWLKRLPLPPSPDPFAQFVTEKTVSTDRLLIQSPDGYRFHGYETKVFPLRFEREVIGSNFSAVHDPAQFLDKVLLGRELKDWRKDELKAALDRWGVSWVFTVNSEGYTLLTDTLGNSGVTVGNYHAFHMSTFSNRFLMGEGLIEAKVNRIELKKIRPQDGLVVIRYRYHPSWRAEPDIPVYSYPIPEDPSGFIALKYPPESVTLRFDPLALLAKQWPKNLNTIEPVTAKKEQASTSVAKSFRAN
jgi:hypothetical protein